MKLASISTPVEVHGGNEVSSFSIAMNGKAFKVLSDTLYQNKIGSIVREVSCNARDAHVAAGLFDLPFEIHLPDQFEPWFSVKDFGIGLSPEQVRNVFCVYFQSSKDQSNDAIGAFGLGAKTPFSYTDQFTVTSTFNGVRTIYSAFITESGIPNIIEMMKSDSTEGNGVEIKMSVKREDYSKFAEEVIYQLRFFKVKPVLVNSKTSADDMFPKTEYQFESENIRIGANSNYYNKIWIVQGDVGYPLDYGMISEKITKSNKELLETMSHLHIEFLFNIGEVGVTASREGIEYNPSTVSNIENKLDVVVTELAQHLNEKFTNETDWEKAVLLNNSRLYSLLAKWLNISTTFAKNSSNGWYFDIEPALYAHKTVQDEDGDDFTTKVTLATAEMFDPTVRRSRSRAYVSMVQPSATRKYAIYIKDISKRHSARVAKIRAAYPDHRVIILSFDEQHNTIQSFKKLISETLGNHPDIRLTSNVEPDAIKRQTSTRTVTRTTHYTMGYRWQGSKSWIPHTNLDSIKDKQAYIILGANRSFASGMEYQAAEYFEYINFCESVGIKVAPMILISKGSADKIKDKNNFVPVKEYLEELKEVISDNPIVNKLIKRASIRSIINDAIPYSVRNTVLKQWIKNTTGGRDEISRMLRISDKLSTMKEIDKSFLLRKNISTRTFDTFKTKVGIVMTKYEILRHVPHTTALTDNMNYLAQLAQYVNHVYNASLSKS